MKNVKRILKILQEWEEQYPCLVVTLLWKIEIFYTEQENLDEANLIIRRRASIYPRIIEKYKEVDPDSMYLFDNEYKHTSGVIRLKLTPKQLAEQEDNNKKHQESIQEMCDNNPEMDKSMQVESYNIESYTHVQSYIQDNLPGIKSLFDAKFANKKFDDSENRSILDILEAISYDEEKQALFAEETSFYKIDDRYRYGYHADASKFRSVTGHDGKQHLCPFRTIYGLFYRGQNDYYKNCLASIDRNLKPEQIFAERIKSTALERLISSNPAVIPYNEGQPYTLPNGKEIILKYHIDYSALAQHYGVRTSLLDLTTDKMIAAFFACSGYNWKEDNYYVYNKNNYGVIYVYRDKNIFSQESQISCVGLQPLSRPGAQAGYVLAMKPNEDFNEICSEAISFKHDKSIAKQIFEIVNLLGEPFIKDVMSIKAKELVRSNTFSNFDLDKTIEKYYFQEDRSTISKWIDENKFIFTDDETITFTDKDKEALTKESEEAFQQLNTMVYNRVIFCMEIDRKVQTDAPSHT